MDDDRFAWMRKRGRLAADGRFRWQFIDGLADPRNVLLLLGHEDTTPTLVLVDVFAAFGP